MILTIQDSLDFAGVCGIAVGFKNDKNIHILNFLSLPTLDYCEKVINSLPGGISAVGLVGVSRSECVELMKKLEIELVIDPVNQAMMLYRLDNTSSSRIDGPTIEPISITNHVSRVPIYIQCNRAVIESELSAWFDSNVHFGPTQHKTTEDIHVHEALVRLHDWKRRYVGNDFVTISGFVTLLCVTSDQFNDVFPAMRSSFLRSCSSGSTQSDAIAILKFSRNASVLVKLTNAISDVLTLSNIPASPWDNSRFNPHRVEAKNGCRAGIYRVYTLAVVLGIISIGVGIIIQLW